MPSWRGAVVVGVVRDPDLARRLDQRGEQRIARLGVGDAQRTVPAAECVVAAALVAFHALEEGQDVRVAPAPVAHLRPGVEILRLAAHEGHAVDRAGAAEQPAARHRDRAAVGAGLGLGAVEPVGGGIVDQPGEADRNARPGMARRGPASSSRTLVARDRPTAGWRRPRRPIRRRRRCNHRFAPRLPPGTDLCCVRSAGSVAAAPRRGQGPDGAA